MIEYNAMCESCGCTYKIVCKQCRDFCPSCEAESAAKLSAAYQALFDCEEESQAYYDGFDAAFDGNGDASENYSGQDYADYRCGYSDGKSERIWRLQHGLD